MHTNKPDAIVPFWYRLKDFWLFPFKADPLMIISVTALVSIVTILPSFWLRLVDLALLAYVYRYGSEVLQHTAKGNMDPPEHMNLVSNRQGWWQIRQFIIFGLVAVVAVAALPPVLSVAVLVMLTVGYPAATIFLAITEDWLEALNPARWVDMISRIGWAYAAAVLLYLAFLFSKIYLQEWLLSVLPAFFAVVAINFVAYYFAIVGFYLLGYLVHQHHDALGYAQEVLGKTPLPDVRAQLDPDQQLLDECEQLVQEGKLELATEKMARQLKMRGGSALMHQRFHKLLQALHRGDELLAHAKQWLSIQLAQERFSDAATLFVETLAQDPQFRPGQAEEYFPLAKALQKTQTDKALLLLNGFHRQFPKSKDIPKNLLLAAELMQSMGKPDAAKQIVAQLQAKYPENAEVNAFAARLSGGSA
jgi:tetratricopeptide (TPR) repeat protein